MLQMIDDQTIQEIALLNQRYGDQATMTNEAYASEYNALIASADSKREAIEQNMTDLYGAYANGYSRINDATSIFTVIDNEHKASIEQAMYVHQKTMEEIQNQYASGSEEYQKAIEEHTETHEETMKTIWSDLLGDMTSSQAGQLTSWLQMVADAQMHGAELDEYTSGMVNTLISTFNDHRKKRTDCKRYDYSDVRMV